VRATPKSWSCPSIGIALLGSVSSKGHLYKRTIGLNLSRIVQLRFRALRLLAAAN